MCRHIKDMVGPRRISYCGYSIVLAMIVLAVLNPFVQNPDSRKLIVHCFVTFLVVVEAVFVRQCVTDGRLYRTRHEWTTREDHPYQFWYGIAGFCVLGVLATIVVVRYLLSLL